MTALTGSADVDGDRKPDLLARSTAGRLHLYRGDGAGAFAGSRVVGARLGVDGRDHRGGLRRDPTLPAFSSSVRAIDAALLERMRYSHRAGCPVATADLRYVQVTYYGFDRRARTGELVVHRTAATAMTQVFAQLYAARFPIQQMLLVDAYRADDHASMAANNTSAYNCRAVEGGSGWSEHAYGTALDLNPVQNPYVTSSTVLPPAGPRPTSTARTTVPGWSCAATSWCARSPRRAGSGAATGRASRTTSTSPRQDARTGSGSASTSGCSRRCASRATTAASTAPSKAPRPLTSTSSTSALRPE